MKEEEWKNRIAERTDLTTGLVHLSKGNENCNVLEVIIKILNDKKILGSTTESGFICGNIPAVCLQDTPLYSLSQNVYYEQKLRKEKKDKVRYLGWGILISKKNVYKRGGRPVIYDKTSEAKAYLPHNQWWRIVNYDLNNTDFIIDWTHEREWRVPNCLNFELKEITLIVPNNIAMKKVIKAYRDNTGRELVEDTNGVINLGSIFF